LCLYYVLFTIISLLSFETIQAQSTTIISGNKDICQGDSTTLTVVGNFTTYRWSNGNITNAIIVKSSGLYTVTATDSRATPRVDSIFVSVHNPTPFIEGTPFICFGRSTTLSIQGNYRSIQWSTGEQRNRIFANTEGVYTVNVVDSFGCIASAQTTVRDGSKSYNSLPDSVKICQGDSLLLDATTPFAISYYWNTDDTTATIWARDSGRYNVIVSSGQCVNYDTIQVLVLPPPMVNLGSDRRYIDFKG
jgi:hypothetical protein